jgi:hypothetical protein
MEFVNAQSHNRGWFCHCDTLYQKLRGWYEVENSREIEGSNAGPNRKVTEKLEIAHDTLDRFSMWDGGRVER